ncbi:MAG: hypothetical protein J6Y94_08415, partial [Bacteriovoracaceae bacterium]|nr:hypothetical protein [Bacteriovoracaceae bacterium]
MIVGCLAFLAVQMATGQDASPEKNYPVSSTAERCALYVTSPEQMINDAMREVDALSNIMVTKLRPFLSLDLSVLEEKISYSLPTHMLPFKWPSVIKDLDTFLEETDKDYQGTIDRVAQKFAHFYWADPALAERSLKKTVKIQFDVLAKMIKKYGSSYSDDTIHDDFYFSLLAYTTLQVLHDCFAKLKCGEGPEQIINDGVIEFLEFFLHYDKELSPEQKERASKIALKLTKPHSIGLLQQDIVLNLFKRWFPDPDGDDVAETVANNFSKIIDPLAQENGPFIYQLLPRQKVAAKGGPAVKEATPYPRQVLQTIGRHDLSTSQQKQLHRSYAKIFNEHISYHDLETKEYLEVLNKIQYPYIIFNQDRFINDHLPHLIDNPGFPDVFYEAFSNTLDTMDRDLFPAKAPSNKDINAIEEYDEFFARGILPFVKVLQEIRRLHIQRGSAELPEAYWRTLHFLLRFIYVQARDLDTEAKKAKNDEDPFPLVVDNYFNSLTQLIPLISPRDAESLTICLDFYDYWVEHDHSPSIWQHIEDKFGVGVKQIQASPRGQFYVLATLPLIYPLLKDNERFKQGNYFMRAWDEWTPPLARSCIYLSELQPRTARCMEYYPGPNFSADLIGLYTYFFRKVPRDPNLNWPERWEAASDDNQRLEVLYEYLMHQPFFGENWLENIKPEYPDQSVEEEAFEKMALTAHLIPPFAYKTAYYQNLVFAMLRQMAKKIPKSILMSDSGPKSVHGVVDLEYPQPHWVKQIFAKKKKNVYSFQVLQNLIKWTSALPNLQAYMAANYSQLTTAEYRQLLDLAIYTWAHQALALSGPAKQDKARAVLPKITDAIKGIISLAGNEDKNSSWYQLMVMITNYYLRGEDSLSLIKDLQEHIAQFTGDRDLPILKMDPQAILDREVKRYELVLWAQLTNAHATNRKLGLILISLINPSHTPDNYALYDSSMANIFVSYRLNKIASGNIVKAQYQAAQDLNQKIEQTLSANAPYQEIKHRLDDIKQGKNY